MSYKDWTEAMLMNVGAVSSSERVARALRLLALVERGWDIEHNDKKPWVHMTKWNYKPDLELIHMVREDTLESAITAAEAEEAKREK